MLLAIWWWAPNKVLNLSHNYHILCLSCDGLQSDNSESESKLFVTH